MKNKFILLVISYCSLTLSMYGQQSYGGRPITFDDSWSTSPSNRIKNISQVSTNQLSVIDNVSEASEAEKMTSAMGEQKSMIYGKGIEINVDFKQVAKLQLLGDSGKLYLYQITSPSAYALQVYFDAFKLPKGARMFIYDQAKTMFLGSFTNKNNYINNQFGTQFIPGNTVVIEYYEPNNVEFESQIHISRISHAFIDIQKSGIYTGDGGYASGRCNINASCMLGYGWERERKSVAIILFDVDPIKFEKEYHFKPKTYYYGFGTGNLINNVRQDGSPYFLTANHIYLSNPEWSSCAGTDVANWLFLFDHESSCSSDGADAPSNLYFRGVYGARVLSQDDTSPYTSDFLLLSLNIRAEDLANWKAVWAGWNRDEISGGLNTPYTVCIHHPSGDVRKISTDNDPPIDATTHSPIYYWQVRWDNGVTEPGSSGAALFNANHQIIGQLRGGKSSCENPNYPDLFGKFSYSYEKGFLWIYLDPDLTRSTSIGSYNPSNGGEHCYNGVWDSGLGEISVDCGGECPDCNWITTTGWGCTTCNNDVMDKVKGETGVDCGGSCKPCGGIKQCTNGIQDGDETDVDCGGSCVSCNAFCVGQVIYQNTDQLPEYTSTSNFIIAEKNVSVTNNQVVYFKSSGKITLKDGFSAKEGSVFKAANSQCVECKKIHVYYYPKAIAGELRISQSGVDRYDITVKKGSTKIYSSTGYIYEKNPCLWNSSTTRNGAYVVSINLYNDCSGEKINLTYIINVITQSNIQSLISSNEIINDESKNYLHIFPNPTKGFINITSQESDPIEKINIYNSSGQLMTRYENNDKKTTIGLNLSNYVDGLYLIHLQTTKGSYSKSIILNK